ncbi:translocation protein S66 [Blyttiomyces sp. JEL0837]|nr:translocation protein S66 [Blyttiomyces sp. JEL0837]
MWYWVGGALIGAVFLLRRTQKSSSKANESSSYFPDHIPKRQYEELAEQYSPQDPHGLKLLTTALMRRAMVDVQRILQIREEKQPLQNLVRTGVIGEDMMEKITMAEKEVEAEIMELMEEAELYRPGWGKTIFQEASNFLQIQAQAQAQALQQAQQAQMAAATAAANSGKDASSPGEVADSPTGSDSLSPEEKEERARRLAEELLKEEEEEKKKEEQRLRSQKGKDNKGGKPGKKK